MKKTFTFLTLIIVPFTIFANENQSNIVDFSYKQETLSNNQKDWTMGEVTYTQKNNANYWQFSVREHERYGKKDNEVYFNGSSLVKDSDQGKTFVYYSLGAGDFNGNGYLPEYRAGVSLQQVYKDGWISPMIEYKYSKYETSYINYVSLLGEKYIGNWRILAGPWLSDSSFYKTTYGMKAQLSYYINDNQSINYYYSSGDEPEIVGSNARVYKITSHALTSKINLSNQLSANFGFEHVINEGVYRRNGVTLGISYAF